MSLFVHFKKQFTRIEQECKERVIIAPRNILTIWHKCKETFHWSRNQYVKKHPTQVSSVKEHSTHIFGWIAALQTLLVVSPCDIWGRTNQILFCDDNDDDNSYKYEYEDDDNFLLHLRRGNLDVRRMSWLGGLSLVSLAFPFGFRRTVGRIRNLF